MRYAQPSSLDEALGVLAAGDTPRLRVIAGGTDVYPSFGDRALQDPLLDVSRVPELRGVSETPDGWRIGGATTWTDLLKAPLPPCFDGLKAAAREVGSVQIQNAATLAGNLCNASPAADGVPPLLTLDASVELRSQGGSRVLPLAEFITGVRRTALQPDELLVALTVPKAPAHATSAFLKLGSRRYLVISICMASAVVAADGDGRVTHARVAVGACSPIALRLPGLEQKLIGARVEARSLAAHASAEDVAPLTPIDDIRASAAYRRAAALELVRRTLAAAVDRGGARHG